MTLIEGGALVRGEPLAEGIMQTGALVMSMGIHRALLGLYLRFVVILKFKLWLWLWLNLRSCYGWFILKFLLRLG